MLSFVLWVIYGIEVSWVKSTNMLSYGCANFTKANFFIPVFFQGNIWQENRSVLSAHGILQEFFLEIFWKNGSFLTQNFSQICLCPYRALCNFQIGKTVSKITCSSTKNTFWEPFSYNFISGIIPRLWNSFYPFHKGNLKAITQNTLLYFLPKKFVILYSFSCSTCHCSLHP